jgi:hypothetical protein
MNSNQLRVRLYNLAIIAMSEASRTKPSNGCAPNPFISKQDAMRMLNTARQQVSIVHVDNA